MGDGTRESAPSSGLPISVIRRRHEFGTATGDERALVRVGKKNTKILAGQGNLSEWTDEELERGRQMDKNGRWVGRPPTVVPIEIHREVVKRTLHKAQELMRENLIDAVEELTKIATDPDVEPQVKLKAIDMIMNRVMGKAPEKVELSVETPPWMKALQGGIVRAREEIIDVEANEPEGLDSE